MGSKQIRILGSRDLPIDGIFLPPSPSLSANLRTPYPQTCDIFALPYPLSVRTSYIEAAKDNQALLFSSV